MPGGVKTSIRWVGRRAYQRMAGEAAKKFRRELRKKLRDAANIVRDEARRNARSTFGSGSGKHGRRKLATSVRSRVKVTSRGANAWVSPRGEQGAYGTVLEHGGTVQRRRAVVRGRSGSVHTRRAHSSDYGAARPWFERAVSATKERVFAVIGRTFNFIR